MRRWGSVKKNLSQNDNFHAAIGVVSPRGRGVQYGAISGGHPMQESPRPLARLLFLLLACAIIPLAAHAADDTPLDRKSTRLNSSHGYISYAVFCLKKKNIYLIITCK